VKDDFHDFLFSPAWAATLGASKPNPRHAESTYGGS
jgi:hypothetical protein